jgi:hypothetical protein
MKRQVIIMHKRLFHVKGKNIKGLQNIKLEK